jgi:hypothetical protein
MTDQVVEVERSRAMRKISEHIPVSRLLPAWADAIAKSGGTISEGDIWDLMAFSIKLHEIEVLASEPMLLEMNEIKLKTGFKTPFEGTAPINRLSHLIQFMDTLDPSTLGSLMVAKKDLRAFADRYNLEIPSILEESEVDTVEGNSGELRKEPSIDFEVRRTNTPSIKIDPVQSRAVNFTALAEILENRKPGPRPIKFERAVAEMRQDIQSGKRSIEDLNALTEDALRRAYDLRRNLARRARKVVTQEIIARNSNKN